MNAQQDEKHAADLERAADLKRLNEIGTLYVCNRADGSIVPLIAVDDLPKNVKVVGLPRELDQREAAEMRDVGFSCPRPQAWEFEYEDNGRMLSVLQWVARQQKAPLQIRKAAREILAAGDAKVPNSCKGFKPKKTHCDHWLKRGECSFVQQGCEYKHEMPMDVQGLAAFGLRDIPKWYRDKYGVSSLLHPRGRKTNSGERSQERRQSNSNVAIPSAAPSAAPAAASAPVSAPVSGPASAPVAKATTPAPNTASSEDVNPSEGSPSSAGTGPSGTTEASRCRSPGQGNDNANATESGSPVEQGFIDIWGRRCYGSNNYWNNGQYRTSGAPRVQRVSDQVGPTLAEREYFRRETATSLSTWKLLAGSEPIDPDEHLTYWGAIGEPVVRMAN